LTRKRQHRAQRSSLFIEKNLILELFANIEATPCVGLAVQVAPLYKCKYKTFDKIAHFMPWTVRYK